MDTGCIFFACMAQLVIELIKTQANEIHDWYMSDLFYQLEDRLWWKNRPYIQIRKNETC